MKRLNKYLTLLALVLGIFTLSACTSQTESNQKKWSYSEKTATFKGQKATIQVLDAKKMELNGNGYGIRIYFKVTNHTSKTDNGYSLLLDQIKDLTQDKKEVQSLTVIGKDHESDLKAIDVDIAPDETKEVTADYKVSTLDSDLIINFQDDFSETLASYTLSLKDLEDASISSIDLKPAGGQ